MKTTKEQILEIINSELNTHNQSMPSLIARKSIAKEIHVHYMKFVEWARINCEIKIIATSSGQQWLWKMNGFKGNKLGAMNDEELYQYWRDEITDK